MEIGDRIKEIRKDNKISQKDFAILLKSSQAKISQIELGNRGIVAEDIILICQTFNVSADYLLGLSEDPGGTDTETDNIDPLLQEINNNWDKLTSPNRHRLYADYMEYMQSQISGDSTDKEKKAASISPNSQERTKQAI